MTSSQAATYAYAALRTTHVVAESTRRSMQGNRGRDTRPEIKLRKALWAAGLRGYRKNLSRLPGKPDIVFGKSKLAIFVHGCYWHQCPKCTRNRKPKTNAEYWAAKFEANVVRDERNGAALATLGFAIVVVWECELKSGIDTVVEAIRHRIVQIH